MSRLGQLNEEQGKAASKQILGKLVDQQLILQKALESKLDRDPKVLQAIEGARHEILSQAYIEQQIAGAKKPSEQEINDFYSKHPELFEKRRVYRLQEISVQASQDRLAEIEVGVKATKNVTQIIDWLKAKDLRFSVSGNVRSAEQLPLELLPRLNQMKDGEILLVPNQGGVNIVLLAASQEQPISKEKAIPIIEQYFLNQRKTEIAKKTVESLRSTAKIEYMGAFSDMKTAAKPKPAEAVKAETQPEAVQAKPDAEHINKGLSGL
jgi:EpsD family peptidyl-prolyl cis-trans isomerase